MSAVTDHEKSSLHLKAVEVLNTKNKSVEESQAVRTLRSLKQADRDKSNILFRNAHAIIKTNRPLQDCNTLCQLDKAKGLELGETYLNEKAALEFVKAIATADRNITRDMLQKANCFCFMMDGSTDFSGDEQEAVYVRISVKGSIIERFPGIGSPESTTSKHLEELVITMFRQKEIDTGKLVGMASDGASNMVGVNGELAVLLRQQYNPELVNIYCLAHLLELGFRDVLKKNKLYDKIMILMIGLHYFYTKSYNNKKSLQNSIKGCNTKKIDATESNRDSLVSSFVT